MLQNNISEFTGVVLDNNPMIMIDFRHGTSVHLERWLRSIEVAGLSNVAGIFLISVDGSLLESLRLIRGSQLLRSSLRAMQLQIADLSNVSIFLSLHLPV